MVKNLSDNEEDLRCRFDPRVEKILGEGNGNQQETQGQRSLVGCSPWGPTELDKTEGN